MAHQESPLGNYLAASDPTPSRRVTIRELRRWFIPLGTQHAVCAGCGWALLYEPDAYRPRPVPGLEDLPPAPLVCYACARTETAARLDAESQQESAT